jgi:hypothetical protein
MVKENVLMISSVTSAVQIKRIDRDGITHEDICRLTMTHRFINADLPDDHYEIQTITDGFDTTDKAPSKAITAGVKYALIKVLLISTGDDPEKEEDDNTQKPTAKTQAKTQGKTKQNNKGDGDCTDNQVKAISAICGKNFNLHDDTKHQLLSKITSRDIKSTKALTFAEASNCITVLNDSNKAQEIINSITGNPNYEMSL